MSRIWTPSRITGALIGGLITLGGAMLIQMLLVPRSVPDEQLQEWGAHVYPQPRELTAFSLVDHQGQPFDNQRLQQTWTLAFLGFTRCPDVCPTAMATLKQFHTVMEGSPLAATTQVVLISLDPEYDTPERLSHYVQQFDSSFIGVTGDLTTIQSLARQLHVAFEPGQDHGDHLDLLHSDQIVLFDAQGRFAGFFRSPHDAGDMWLAYQAIRM